MHRLRIARLAPWTARAVSSHAFPISAPGAAALRRVMGDLDAAHRRHLLGDASATAPAAAAAAAAAARTADALLHSDVSLFMPPRPHQPPHLVQWPLRDEVVEGGAQELLRKLNEALRGLTAQPPVWRMTSVLKKRRLKMNKHKYKKRLKLTRALRKSLKK